MMATTDRDLLERTCRRILGRVDYRRMEELPPGRYMEVIEMLDEGWDVDAVAEAVDILNRYGWAVQAGVDVAPWDMTEADWMAVAAACPWQRKRAQQLDLFAEASA